MLYSSQEKVNSELLAMTYGAIVSQIIRDYKDVRVVNAELDRMGYNIGVRLIDELLAKAGTLSCANFRETANVIAKVAFKMFLGIAAEGQQDQQQQQQHDGRSASAQQRTVGL
jgi:hypothetical protein